MKSITKTYLKVAAAVISIAAISSCQGVKLKRVRVAPNPVTVKVQTVGEKEEISRKSYVGSVEVAKEAIVNSSHSGELESLCVKQGQKVAKGSLLGKVRSQSVLSAYNMAMATLKQAEDGYERASKVYESGSVSQVKMVEIQTQLAQARASADAATEALKECEIRAPFAGEVSEIFIHQGERVGLAQPVLSIVDAQGLEIVISVPETEVHEIKPGDEAVVTVSSLGVSIPAIVKTKAVVGSTISHSYKCTLTPSVAVKDMLPGMVCKVSLEDDMLSGVSIPADAVKIDGQGKYVWTVSEGKVGKTRVETGAFSSNGVLVLSGLENGDKVIVEGTSKVSTGMKVNVRED